MKTKTKISRRRPQVAWFETSKAGYDLIERFEGLHKVRPDGLIEAYKIGNDLPTIGIGQTGKMPDGRRVELGLVITKQEAYDALQHFVRNVTEPLVRKHFVCQTQAEFDACVSWVYNVNHAKLEAGQYSLPQLVNRKERDLEALVNLWLRYIHTPGFENGLYKRRIAEILMFLGLPWNTPAVWGYIASAIYKKGGVINPTDPWFILQIAEKAAEALSPPPPPPPPPAPEPAPAPKPEAKAEPKPAEPAKPAPAPVKKPPSPNTKLPQEVGLDPNAGLKHVSESDRAKGWMWRQVGILLFRVSGLGLFGNGLAVASQTVMADQMLFNAVFELWVPLAVNGGTLATSYVLYQWGKFKEYQGREKGTQALYV
jgi:GH24 family phage-related lysozyme (muramidase)